jgi:hypothetical protein
MLNKFALSCVLVASLLTGCATTPSKPLSFNDLGQFKSYPLNATSYRISFEATHHIAHGTAEEIALLKAAQTTLHKGFRYFKVLNDPSNRNTPPRQAVVYPSSGYQPYGFYRYPYYRDPFFDQPRIVNVDPVQVSYSIECYKDQKNAPADAFDASLILQSLGPQYGLGPQGQVLTPPHSP